MENVRDRVNPESNDHFKVQQMIKRQSKVSLKGIVDPYENFSV